jgi:hypothetical membrane protein
MDVKLRFMCGAFGPPLFIAVLLIAGAGRADYSALRHPVSSLSFGDDGWIQRASFVTLGTLLLVFASGLGANPRSPWSTRWGTRLIVLVAVGFLGAGAFNADPLNGYPPGTPALPDVRTAHGRAHDLFSALVFFAIPASALLHARTFARSRRRHMAAACAVSAAAMVVAFVPAALGCRQVDGFDRVAGLFQRIAISIGLGWVSLLSVYILTRGESGTPPIPA